jgi:hypothetical protein
MGPSVSRSPRPCRTYDLLVRRVLVVVLVLAAAVGGYAVGSLGSDDEVVAATGDAAAGDPVRITYPEVPRKWRAWQDRVRESGVLEDAARDLTAVVALPRTLTVEVTSCSDGTGYLQGEALIELCLQDVKSSDDELRAAKAEDRAATLEGIWRETFFHESGHAVLDLLDLPFTGREEDVADQFAAWRLAESGDDASTEALLSSAYEYTILAGAYEADPNDEHASDAARAVNYLCYLYGSDPEQWDQLVDDDPLTRERADQCEDEWDGLRVGWRQLLDDAGALRS